jgi:D-alanyl-D-alanine carboxypeptidase
VLTRSLDRVVAAGAPGATVLVRDGKHAMRASRGYASPAAGRPMLPTQRTRVGSITKTFVATAILQLAGEHRLAPDTVERWLPGLVPGGGAITVRHLLAHRAGLPEFYGDQAVMQPYLDGDFGHAWDPRDLVRMATSHAPLFAPGTGWSYSNTNYIVLGLIAEAATGRPIAAELEQRIFAPLRLDDASLPSTPRIAGGHVHGHLGNGPFTDVTAVHPFTWTAGAVVSTPPTSRASTAACSAGGCCPIG